MFKSLHLLNELKCLNETFGLRYANFRIKCESLAQFRLVTAVADIV